MKKMISLPVSGSITAIFLALLTLSSSGCKEKTVEPEEENKFEGIQIVYENGQSGGTIGDASDDWQPMTETGAHLRGAIPNPANSITRIAFKLAQQDSVRIWMESSPGKLAMEIFRGVLASGSHLIEVDVQGRDEGIYRVYMTVYRGQTSHTSYGDLMIDHGFN